MLLNAYVTHREPPPLDFPHELLNRRDRSDPELAPHLKGFMGFVMDRGNRPMTQTRYHILRHLERVRHHLAVEVEDAHGYAFSLWAQRANAIVFMTDSSVRAPNGAILVAPGTGEAAPGAEVPFPADAIERKRRSESTLGPLGIDTPPRLPPVVSDVEVDLVSAREVALRCFALFTCAVRAESLSSGDAIPAAELMRRMPIAFTAMSPSERAFVASPAPAEQEIVNHAWRYEALLTLQWALGAASELPFPTTVCDGAAIARTMLAQRSDTFVDQAQLRPTSEILDALDLHFRVHWATTEARVQGAEPPASLEPGVIHERHYALNWLTRFREADWDDVETPT